jgi:hypothetical protein
MTLHRRGVLLAELEVGCRDDRVDLIRPAEACDRPVDPRVAERPGDRDRAGRDAELLGDLPQALDEPEVARELRLAVALAAPAPVILGQGLDPLARHRPGQQPDAIGE